MNARDMLRMLGLAVTEWQWRAMRYLEIHGQRFLIEFGTDNAVQKAREHWKARRAKRPSRQKTSW